MSDLPSQIYKDKKGNRYYNANQFPDTLPSFHKRLMHLHIVYLFFLPSLAILLNEMYYESSGWFRLTAWLILSIYVGFVINNYKIAVNKKKALWAVFIVPIELILLSLIFKWGLVFEVIDWALVEIVGFFLGMTFGTVFRKAPISLGHRFISFLLVLGFIAVIFLGFQNFIEISYSTRTSVQLCFLTIPYLTAMFNYSQLFIQGEFGGEHDVNMGTSPLMDNLTGLVAISAVIWLFLPSIGKGIGPF